MNQKILSVIAIALIGLFGTWFFLTHEKISGEEYIGFRGEARYNQFLAAEMLLSELGVNADSISSLAPSEWLPDTSDTIYTQTNSVLAVAEQRYELLHWIEDGGHVVLELSGQPTTDIEEMLLEIGYRVIERSWSEDDEQDNDEQDDGENEEEYDYVVDLEWSLYRIEAVDDTEQSATLSDEHGLVVTRRSWGNGYITIIVDDYFTNNRLGDDDHAKLLMDITAGYVDPGTVWFVYNTSFPSLAALIWGNARFVVIGAAALLLLALWAAIPKFGPRINPVSAQRRSIIEHVRAAGVFTWRQDGADTLAENAVTAMLHEAESRHPGIGRLPLKEQARRIAQMTGRDPQTVINVLSDTATYRQREFTQHMNVLQSIRKEL